MTDATVRVMSPEEIAARAGGETPFLEWPRRASLFAERALRLRQLAAGHAMRDYLIFMADVAQEQQALLDQYPQRHPGLPLPDVATLEQASAAGLAPLPATSWQRDPAWRDGLRTLLAALGKRLAAGPAADAVRALAQVGDDEIEQQADRLLHGVMLGLDLARAPLIGAALQVYWTHLVLETQRVHGGPDSRGNFAFGRTDDATACPCCASPPVASVTRLGADVAGQRYLHCSLCAAQWHMVRIKCARCESVKHIAYQSLEAVPGHAAPATGASAGAVQAETCDDCKHYLKIMHMQKDPNVDPVADDLASVTLDLLVADTGWQRHGVNLMLLFGDPEASEPPDPGGG